MHRKTLGAVAASAVALVLAASPVAAENAHFVPAEMTAITLANANQDIQIGWKVAGLGNGPTGSGSSGRIWLRGWVRTDATCTTKKGTQSQVRNWTKRAVDHAIFRDEFGNATATDILNTPLPCPNGQIASGVSIQWACVDAKLSADVKPYKVWDTFTFYDYPRSTDCERTPPTLP